MIRLFLLFALGLALPFLVPQYCGGARAAASGTPTSSPDATYTVRGRVIALPNPPRQFLDIHHERIPDFKNEKGETIGMNEMVMAFPFVAPTVSLEGLAPNDPIELTFEMRFKNKPRFLVTKMTELPPDTQLNLGKLD